MSTFNLISDCHGYLPDNLSYADYLIIAGDITSDNYEEEDYWVKEKFFPWLRKQPHKNKIFIAGNHDFYFDKNKKHDLQKNEFYLENDFNCIDGINFYGSPLSVACSSHWVFQEREQILMWYWEKIPQNTEVLVVHGPPDGILDQVGRFGNQVSVGSCTLMKRIKELKNLKLVVFGHIHEAYGILKDGNIIFVNASLRNFNMKVTNNPIYLEI